MVWGFITGTAIGGGLVMVATAILLLLGAVQLMPPRTPPESRYLLFTSPLFMLAVVWMEELLFRSVLVGGLSRVIGVAAAIGVSIAVDLLLHVPNGVPNVLMVANSALFSLGVSLAYVWGGLALAVGLHYGWNLVQWTVLGYPIYGHSAPRWLEVDVAGAPWLTGGGYGLEASLAALIALGMANAVFAGWMLQSYRAT